MPKKMGAGYKAKGMPPKDMPPKKTPVKKAGMHMMPDGHMMSDAEMKTMMNGKAKAKTKRK